MDNQKENPLRGPWTYVVDMDSVVDCDGHVVAELTKRASQDARGRAVRKAPELFLALQYLMYARSHKEDESLAVLTANHLIAFVTGEDS